MSLRSDIRRFCAIALASAAICCFQVSLSFSQSLLPILPSDSLEIRLVPAHRDTVVRLPHQFIAGGSDTIVIGTRRLERGKDFTITYRTGSIRFDSLFMSGLGSDSTLRGRTARLTYEYFPFHFQDSYSHRTLVVVRDSSARDSLRIARQSVPLEIEDFFGPNLQRSGSIIRGFTIGSNRDLSLNSGFRMQLAGKLSSDVEVAASLTDENTPIQPEGTTQTLQEFDKVFVEIKSPHLGATLGDFNLSLGQSEFARISRKLQGAQGTATYQSGGTGTSLLVSGAITKGKFATNQFTGADGVQGPYRLSGRNGERDIIAIAGTERVYVNGERQTRGETNEYTIDYSTAEVTFTTRRLITAASRIVVDFEYTDRQYARSLFAAQSVTSLFDSKARVAVTYLREADDPDSPIDFTVTDSARTVLENAGDDRDKAVQSGVTRVDSNGLYVQVDTLLAGGTPKTFYRYAPGNPAARYVITFTLVGAGKGEYVRQQVDVYVWRGPNQGDYLPVRYLPLPELHQLVDIALEASPSKEFSLSGEYAGSVLDANRFSTIGDENNAGYALKFGAAYAPKDVRIDGTRIGGLDMRLNERFTKSTFVPADRANDIEFTRKWGIDTLESADEEIREGSLRYLPVEGVSIGGGYGRIVRGSLASSTRIDGVLNIKGAGLPVTDYLIERVKSDEAASDNASDWLRQKGSIEYTFWNLTPFGRFEGEDRRLSTLSTALLKQGSFRFSDITGGLRFKQGTDLSLSAEFGSRIDDAFNQGDVVRQSAAFTQAYSGRLSTGGDFTTALDVTLRKRSFSEEFKNLGNQDIKTVLVRSQTRFTPLERGIETDLFYEVATEQSSRMQRVFVRVAAGTGNYRYLGDLNGNGIAEESEFEQVRFDGDYIVVSVPTDQLYPIIDLKTSIRLRLTPSRFLGTPTTWMTKALSVLSAETFARVDEKSTEPDIRQIVLLHFSKFQNDSATIAGSSQFTQDLFLFENRPEFSTRLRFSQRRGLNNYAGGAERSYGKERSVRIRWQLVQEISNQIDYVNKVDRLSTLTPSTRARDILSNDLTFDLSYRPQQNIEFGLKFEVARSTDSYVNPALGSDLNVESGRLVYAFQGAGQARMEFSREEVVLGGTAQTYPYELTGGRVPGKTWIWRAGFDYRLTNFIQATLNYEGRTEGGNPPVHTGSAEVRAFF